MAAKIKDRNPYGRGGHKHKPRGLNDKDFEKVYWPFIPIIVAASVMIGLAGHSGTLASYIKHPTSRVLSYETSQNSQSLLTSTNSQREVYGSGDLTISAELSAAAQAKAKDMALRNYWSHNTPEGTEPWVFINKAGYNYQKAGENLAVGFSDEQSVVKAWMASPSHKENLIDPAYTEVGFGFADAPSFKATGNTPSTIVVAYYARPNVAPSIVPTTISTSSAPSTVNKIDSKILSSTTSRSSIAFSRTSATTWGPYLVVLSIVGISLMLIRKHSMSVRHSIKRGERYIWRHPLVDLIALLIIALLAVLSQTAGYIQ